MVSEKKLFKVFSHYKSMKAIGLQGCSLSLDPRSLTGRTYVGTIRHCYILNIQVVGLTIQRIRFFFFHHKSLGAIDPWGIASLDHMGLISRIYIGEK